MSVNVLGKSIQSETHSSIEDASAAMELALNYFKKKRGRIMCLPLPNGLYEYAEMNYAEAVSLLELDSD